MTQFDSPETGPQSPYATVGPGSSAPQPKNNSKLLLIIAGVLILALGGTVAYLLMSGNKKTNEIEKLTENKEQLELEIDELDSKFQQKVIELDQIMADKEVDDKEKAQKIQELLGEIQVYKNKLNKAMSEGNLLKTQLDEYKGKYETLEYYNKKYLQEIEKLKAENAELRDMLEKQDSALAVANDKLYEKEQQVDLYKTKEQAAAILQAIDFKFAALKKNGKPADDDPTEIRGKKIHTFQACFTLAPNTFAPKGSTTIYAVVKGPKGVYKDLTKASGYFKVNGKELTYTMKGSINYQGAAQKVCLTYEKPQNEVWDAGQTTVTVYANGYEIGKTTLTVK